MMNNNMKSSWGLARRRPLQLDRKELRTAYGLDCI